MRRYVLSGCAAATILILASSTAASATPASAPSSDSFTTVGVTSEVVTVEGTEAQASACTAFQRGDRVHISGTAPAAASAHGWWVNNDCEATKADVTTQLQIKRGDIFVNVGSPGKKRVYSGGGSANRSHARLTCANRLPAVWRSVIDVDLVGQIDSANKTPTEAVTINCRV